MWPGPVWGALFFGWLTDRVGRKKLFMITLRGGGFTPSSTAPTGPGPRSARLTESRRQHPISPFQNRSRGSCSGRPERRRRDELASRAGANPDQYRTGAAVPRSAAQLALLDLHQSDPAGSDADDRADPAAALAAAAGRGDPRRGRTARLRHRGWLALIRRRVRAGAHRHGPAL